MFALRKDVIFMAKRRANGEGNIRKRKDGRWEGRFTAGFTLETYAHVTTTAQKEAAQTMGNILSM